jgi:hypothetical protein
MTGMLPTVSPPKAENALTDNAKTKRFLVFMLKFPFSLLMLTLLSYKKILKKK